MKRFTRAYITHFNMIVMEQTLLTGRKIRVEWRRAKQNLWMPRYSTDSAYHICPYDGQFVDCVKCECYNESDEAMIKACLSKREQISDDEMASRATACANAKGCTINFRSTDE